MRITYHSFHRFRGKKDSPAVVALMMFFTLRSVILLDALEAIHLICSPLLSAFQRGLKVKFQWPSSAHDLIKLKLCHLFVPLIVSYLFHSVISSRPCPK